MNHSTESLSFRKMTTDDLTRVAIIEQSASPYPNSQTYYSSSLDSGHCCEVVECDGEILGYGVVSLVCSEATLLALVVAKEAQGKGIGRALLQHLIDISSDRAECIFLEVRQSNQRARRLYQQLSFKEIDQRPGYYPTSSGNPREEAVVMQRKL